MKKEKFHVHFWGVVWVSVVWGIYGVYTNIYNMYISILNVCIYTMYIVVYIAYTFGLETFFTF